MPNIPLVAEDIDCFFELGELSVNAVLNGEEIQVIYREDYFNADQGEFGIDNSSPMCIAKFEDAEDTTAGDLIEIEGETFTITSVKPTRSELYTKLFLEET